MDTTRRNFLRGAAFAGAGLLAAERAQSGQRTQQHHPVAAHTAPVRPSQTEEEYLPVRTPDVADLPYTLDNGVKVFHLAAEPVKQELLPGRVVDLWGYNGSAPGPTIQVNQGDRVRIIVDNHLPEPTAMHWHGFEIPYSMDGSPGLGQDAIPPGGRFVYEFTLHQAGTFFYHSHMAMQEMIGMLGAFIMHPREAYAPHVDHDFALLLQEYAILPNNSVPNSMNMEFNWLAINGKAGPATTPLVVPLGARVRLRLINLGMDHHPIHLHGHTFVVTGTEGGRQPETTWGPGNTVLVGVAQSRDVEFVASNPGDWMIHCHLPHHMMNQMSSMVGERPISNGPLSPARAAQTMMRQMDDATMQHQHMPQMHMGADVSPNARAVPGFPQDAFMEGPMMSMDGAVHKPETLGLRPGWTGYMQGMMTLLRVLPLAQYDHIMALRGEKAGTRDTSGVHAVNHQDHGQ